MTQSFNKRFNIQIDLATAQEQFVNRIYAGAFRELREVYGNARRERIASAVGLVIGIDSFKKFDIQKIVGMEYRTVLHAVEGLYAAYEPEYKAAVDQYVLQALRLSETSLEVIWRDGHFYPAGAELLDDKLVNDSLQWLREERHTLILGHFEKALLDYSESVRRPEKLSDVVIEMYKALEATAKFVNDNDNDLSANAEKFISNLGLAEPHKAMLKAYIDYANKIVRHAQSHNSKPKQVSAVEAENFIYLTGIFIRFAIQQLQAINKG